MIAAPRLSIFPKCYFDLLCRGEMDYVAWIHSAAALGGDGRNRPNQLDALLLARLHASERCGTGAPGRAPARRDRSRRPPRDEILPHAERPAVPWPDSTRGHRQDGGGIVPLDRARRPPRRGPLSRES